MSFSRQQILLGVLGLVGLLTAGDWIVNTAIQGPLSEKRQRTEALKEGISKRREMLKETRAAGKRIEQWKAQSLPADTEIARSLYRSWLHDRVQTAGLTAATVDSGSPSRLRGRYSTLPFSVRGRGTLDQFTSLIFQFDQAGHLHRIRSLNIAPAGAGLFNLSLGIEALIVPGTKRKDRLSKTQSKRLASTDVRDYEVISRRNLFGVGYRDPLAQTRLTAITWKNGSPQVWIQPADEGVVRKLGIDDQLDVADFSARVVSATREGAVLETNGRRMLVRLGQSLADGRPVPPSD